MTGGLLHVGVSLVVVAVKGGLPADGRVPGKGLRSRDVAALSFSPATTGDESAVDILEYSSAHLAWAGFRSQVLLSLSFLPFALCRCFSFSFLRDGGPNAIPRSRSSASSTSFSLLSTTAFRVRGFVHEIRHSTLRMLVKKELLESLHNLFIVFE